MCPFCGSTFTAGRPPRYLPSVRVTAVAAVSATIALGGCAPVDSSSYGVAETEDCCLPSTDGAVDIADATVSDVGSDGASAEAPVAPDAVSEEGPTLDVSVTDAPTDAGADGATA